MVAHNLLPDHGDPHEDEQGEEAECQRRGRAKRLVGWDPTPSMSQFETFECRECGETFVALPESNAATDRSCSPACETAQLAVQ